MAGRDDDRTGGRERAGRAVEARGDAVGAADRGIGAEVAEPASAVRHEEELDVGTESYESGSLRAQKRVETERVEHVEPRAIEYGDFERARASAGDSGEIETLEDGSISIPLFEERLVVTKELFVRERVILRKRTVTAQHRIEAELRRERIEIEGEVQDEDSGTQTSREGGNDG